jgi:Tol biopolymer transport system component
LTTGDFNSYSRPSWSPDGRYLVYYSAYFHIKGLKIFPVEGSTIPYNASFLVQDAHSATWSPGGSWIAYTDNTGIGLIRPDRTEQRHLTTGGGAGWALLTGAQ